MQKQNGNLGKKGKPMQQDGFQRKKPEAEGLNKEVQKRFTKDELKPEWEELLAGRFLTFVTRGPTTEELQQFIKKSLTKLAQELGVEKLTTEQVAEFLGVISCPESVRVNDGDSIRSILQPSFTEQLIDTPREWATRSGNLVAELVNAGNPAVVKSSDKATCGWLLRVGLEDVEFRCGRRSW